MRINLKKLNKFYVMTHEEGFQKALCQVALFASQLELNKFNVNMDVKYGILMKESQIKILNRSMRAMK